MTSSVRRSSPLEGWEIQTVLASGGLLEPGEKKTFTVKGIPADPPTLKRLRIIGGTEIPAPWNGRGEEAFRQWEYWIDDSLDGVNRVGDAHSLLFEGAGEDFARMAWHRIGAESLAPGDAALTARIRREHLRINPGGRLGIGLELFLKKEGRSVHDVYDAPDREIFLPVEAAEGDGQFVTIKRDFRIPGDIAAIVVATGGRGFSGRCWMEAPRIDFGGGYWHVPFVENSGRGSGMDYWVGCNLATRNWPVWALSRNGAEIFRAPVFDRASDVADFTIPLPRDLQNGERLTLELVRRPHLAGFPYTVESIQLIQVSGRDLEVRSAPRILACGRDFGLLVETQKPGMKIGIECSDSIEPAEREVIPDDTGFHVLRFRALETPGTGNWIRIRSGSIVIELKDLQLIVQPAPSAWLSTGDEIYLDMNRAEYLDYFRWFIQQRVGNFYQFRPSYQWSGFRRPERQALGRCLGLLQQMGIPYAWQVEGRTLAAAEINPPLADLQSPLFHGKQAHENDGGYYYWNHFRYQGFWSDMAARTRPYGGIFAKHRPIFTDHGTFIHYDPESVFTMKEGADQFVANLAYSRGESSRHTGPSTLFRYFFQAGYSWIGAEQMYGPEDVILSALRGAGRAYGKDEYGSLHAMQWGSRPFTSPKHSRRFFLSLATAWMNGVAHINTEEALWTDEYSNDRFSRSGKDHLEAQHKILDLAETRQRRGRQITPIAVLQGRNDGWKCFGRSPLWSQRGESWKFNRAAESFDLLKVFYPESVIDSSGPEGWFSTTPFGAVDLLPIEASERCLECYDAVVFAGWNNYERRDFEKLLDYVEKGGTLLLTAAHLNLEGSPDGPVRIPKDDPVLTRLLGAGYDGASSRRVRGVGGGEVVYYPQKLYPADEAVAADYRKDLEGLARRACGKQQPRGWIVPGSKVAFTAWDAPELRTLYLLNVDWEKPGRKAEAELTLGGGRFPLLLRNGDLETVWCAGDSAAMAGSRTTELLAVEGPAGERVFVFQTTGSDRIRFFRPGGAVMESILKEAGIHRIPLD